MPDLIGHLIQIRRHPFEGVSFLLVSSRPEKRHISWTPTLNEQLTIHEISRFHGQDSPMCDIFTIESQIIIILSTLKFP